MQYQKEDTTALIFDSLFLCRFPDMQTRSAEHIRMFGIVYTGDSAMDKDLSNQWITTYITIAKMVEFHKTSVPIKVVKYEDVKKIYDYISRHLHAWKSHIEDGLNIGNAPIDDLIAMDEFANTVYDQAKFQFTRSIADSILMRQLSTVGRFNKDNIFSTPVVSENTVINPIEDTFKRDSLADIFKDRKVGKRWN